MNGSSKPLLAIMQPHISTADRVGSQCSRRAVSRASTNPTSVNRADDSGNTASAAVICTVDSEVNISAGTQT